MIRDAIMDEILFQCLCKCQYVYCIIVLVHSKCILFFYKHDKTNTNPTIVTKILNKYMIVNLPINFSNM